ncbi:MAG UNVERIFIED_CONTAM: hypothetical protein LVR29_19440 [Microcystis novacekii LVE1205-3]|jgi:hypothetical protein
MVLVQVDWVPHLADGDSGIGRGLVVQDINADGLVDIASGGMVGASVLTHVSTTVTEEEFLRGSAAEAEGHGGGSAAGGMSAQAAVRNRTSNIRIYHQDAGQGDACFFAGRPEKFYKFAGEARNKVGDELN